MNFNFEVNIKETKGAVNTAAKIAEVLKNGEVTFSSLKNSDYPCIHVKFPDKKNKMWVGTLRPAGDNEDYYERYYKGWRVTFAAGYDESCDQSYLFGHATDAAKELIDAWVDALVDEYQERLNADMKDKHKITINIEIEND